MKDDKSKKRKMGKIVIGIIVGLVVISVIASMGGSGAEKVDQGQTSGVVSQGASQSKPEETKTEFAVGDVIKFDSKEVSVTSVERNWDSGNQFIKPDAGKEYVKVSVSIKNDSGSTISYNALDWKMRDSSGDIKSYSIGASADDSISYGELSSGGTKVGSVVFEVPSGDNGLVLQYEPGFWSSKKLEIKL